MGITAEMQYQQGIYARLKKLEEHIFTPPPTAPPPTAEAFVFTGGATQPSRGSNFVFDSFGCLSTEQLVNDLNGLDNLLAHMLLTLEMRDVKMDEMPFECISSPSIFLHDLQELHDAFHAIFWTTASMPAEGIMQLQKTLYEAFKTSQLKKQAYTGPRFSLPNAGDYKGKKWVQKVAPHNGGIIIDIEKPNAIKQTDMELSLPLLLEKVAVFTEQRLEISKMLCTWWVTMYQNEHDARKALWRPELAGKPTPTHTLISPNTSDRNSMNWGKPRYYTKAEFDKAQLAGEEKTALRKEDFKKKELEHIRVATQDLRERMLLLAQCSPTLQMALREGVGEPRIEASVADVRVLWEKELLGRYSSKRVHPVDMI